MITQGSRQKNPCSAWISRWYPYQFSLNHEPPTILEYHQYSTLAPGDDTGISECRYCWISASQRMTKTYCLRWTIILEWYHITYISWKRRLAHQKYRCNKNTRLDQCLYFYTSMTERVSLARKKTVSRRQNLTRKKSLQYRNDKSWNNTIFERKSSSISRKWRMTVRFYACEIYYSGSELDRRNSELDTGIIFDESWIFSHRDWWEYFEQFSYNISGRFLWMRRGFIGCSTLGRPDQCARTNGIILG